MLHREQLFASLGQTPQPDFRRSNARFRMSEYVSGKMWEEMSNRMPHRMPHRMSEYHIGDLRWQKTCKSTSHRADHTKNEKHVGGWSHFGCYWCSGRSGCYAIIRLSLERNWIQYSVPVNAEVPVIFGTSTWSLLCESSIAVENHHNYQANDGTKWAISMS